MSPLAMGRLLCAISLLAVIGAWSADAMARELHWRELTVSARLDASGQLHVSERHQMVFTGDWNGGERSFRVEDDQQLKLQSLSRLGADGRAIPLSRGGLQNVDQYDWADAHTLRWRSRPATSAPFDHTELGYRIDYQLLGVLERDGDRDFTLDHEFAFRDRPGEIERFRLHLELDPAWTTDRTLPIELERRDLRPGEGIVLTLPLHYTGAELQPEPSWLTRVGAYVPADWPRRLVVSVAFLGIVLALARVLIRRATRLGHFEPAPSADEIDAKWITKHLLPLKAEVVGAAYDRHTGSAEVAALLARLALERKISAKFQTTENAGTGVEHTLELELLVERSVFVDYERVLVDKLFVAGDRTSTETIRAHYRRFDPSLALRAPLARRLGTLLGPNNTPESWRWLIPLLIGVAAVVLLNGAILDVVASWWGLIDDSVLSVVTLIGMGVFLLFGVFCAASFRNDPEPRLIARSLLRWLSAAALLVVFLMLMAPAFSRAMGLVMHFFAGLAFVGLVFWKAWQLDRPAGIALRKHLYAARRYFHEQLKKERPELDDAWYPYLLAFGLSPDVDAWSRSFGERATHKDAGSTVDASDSGASSSSRQPRWTGGGGSFGGAGASGSWASAASELAAGVAPARSSSSSSSSGSSSSSSSSRSGGGGGGGW